MAREGRGIAPGRRSHRTVCGRRVTDDGKVKRLRPKGAPSLASRSSSPATLGWQLTGDGRRVTGDGSQCTGCCDPRPASCPLLVEAGCRSCCRLQAVTCNLALWERHLAATHGPRRLRDRAWKALPQDSVRETGYGRREDQKAARAARTSPRLPILVSRRSRLAADGRQETDWRPSRAASARALPGPRGCRILPHPPHRG